MPASLLEPLDRDKLVDALADADLRVLLMCLFHVTGDRRWLADPYRPRRDVKLIADEQAGLPPGIADEIRAAAVDVLTADSVPAAITDPGDDLMLEMMRWCMDEPIDAGYAPMMREDLGLITRDVEWTHGPPDTPPDRYVVIVGAGASGLILGLRLLRLGIPFTILERGADVGGTWRDNTYPGCGVDTPNHAYSFSIGHRHAWTRNFSPQPELLDYLRQWTDAFGLREHICFDHSVTGATWNETTQAWDVAVATPDGPQLFTGTDLVAAIGQFGIPSIPDIAGADEFAGRVVPHDRLARRSRPRPANGSRSSARERRRCRSCRRSPTTSPNSTIFQRSPQWARPIPRYHDLISRRAQWLLDERAVLCPVVAVHDVLAIRRRAVAVSSTRSRLATPRTITQFRQRTAPTGDDRPHRGRARRPHRPDRDVCTPTYPPYGKRILLDNGWYRTLLRPNVELVTDRIDGSRRWNPHGRWRSSTPLT